MSRLRKLEGRVGRASARALLGLRSEALLVSHFSSASIMSKTTAPYGTWTSLVTPEVVLKSVRDFDMVPGRG